MGEFGLIDRILRDVRPKHPGTVLGAGDDASVMDPKGNLVLMTTDLLLEGIHFDLTYTPLRHLGYKTVIAGISDIYAMNGTPRQVQIGLGLSGRFRVEQVDEFYEGVKYACEVYGVDLAGGDTSASLTGLTVSVSVLGGVAPDRIVYRSGAQVNDLVCVTGNLGAAYMGLKLLEREKRVLRGNEAARPRLEGYEYPLRRQLMPEARRDVVETLAEAGILPTSMIDITDGLASEILHICKDSDKGARIYLNRLPIARETFDLAEEFHFDPVVAALNGGDDYELLFTVPLDRHEDALRLPGVDVIGHITGPEKGVFLTTPDGQEIAVKAQGWVEKAYEAEAAAVRRQEEEVRKDEREDGTKAGIPPTARSRKAGTVSAGQETSEGANKAKKSKPAAKTKASGPKTAARKPGRKKADTES